MNEKTLLEKLELWFTQLGSDDPQWWAKEIHSYLELDDTDKDAD